MVCSVMMLETGLCKRDDTFGTTFLQIYYTHKGRIWAFVISKHHFRLFAEHRPVLGTICLTIFSLPIFVSRAQMPPCLSKSIPSMVKVKSISHLRVFMIPNLASTTLLGLSFTNQKVSLSLLGTEGEGKGMTCPGYVALQGSADLKSIMQSGGLLWTNLQVAVN